MSKIYLSTKGKTLKDLSSVITSAKILPLILFTVKDFNDDKDNTVSRIQDFFKQDILIVRSSSKNEDNFDKSNAGHFKSVTNVSRKNKKEITEAIGTVIASYDSDDKNNEILVQPALTDIKLSGVVLTADIDTLAPYYIINYSKNGKTNNVTSGRAGDLKTYIHFKKSPFKCDDQYLLKVCNICKELEVIFQNPYLDIEFAFDKSGDLYIFQCRPIARKNKEDLSQINLQDFLSNIYNNIEKLSSSYHNLLGKRTLFGVMPDWNPAEMIGIKPRTLALSLYKELITDSVWAYQRNNYGYRDLRSHPLLISFLNVPFIDIRVDFNSFIPKDLNEKIAEKLVDYYIDKLASTPAHHDKVEFKVVNSCYYFNLPDKLEDLLNYGFNENEIKRIEYALLEITNNIVNPNVGLYKSDLQKIELLKEKYSSVIHSNISLIEKIYWLVEDCKRYGTLPFAGIARAAFIAIEFLKSFVTSGIISRDEFVNFMRSLNTVAKKLRRDLDKLSKNEISKEDFLSEYGHLRPGTYDILSFRYDEAFENYFSTIIKTDVPQVSSFEVSGEQMEKIDIALIENGIKADAAGLIKFIHESIEGREYAKFVFTKSVSEILKLIEQLGKTLAIARDDLAYLDIKTLLSLYYRFEPRSIKETLELDITKNKKFYQYTKTVKMPALIRKAKDIYGFFLEKGEPNFITLKKVNSPIITEDKFKSGNIEGKIAFIKSADPGYDFLFTKNISGLVTCFGGANSHMAIRCAELGIPAIIGAGESNFTEWSNAKIIEIDCIDKQVQIIL